MKKNIFLAIKMLVLISGYIQAAQLEKQTKETELEKLNEKLHDKAISGDLKEVEKLLQQGAHPDGFKDELDRTAFLWSINKHHFNHAYSDSYTEKHKDYLKIADLLIKNGANINAEGMFGITALIESLCYLEKESIVNLIKNGANINHQNKKGGTCLMQVINHYHNHHIDSFPDIVNFFLSCTNFEYNLDLLDKEGHAIEYYIDQIQKEEIKNIIKLSIKSYKVSQKEKIEHIKNCLLVEILPDLIDIVQEYLGIIEVKKSKKEKQII